MRQLEFLDELEVSYWAASASVPIATTAVAIGDAFDVDLANSKWLLMYYTPAADEPLRVIYAYQLERVRQPGADGAPAEVGLRIGARCYVYDRSWPRRSREESLTLYEQYVAVRKGFGMELPGPDDVIEEDNLILKRGASDPDEWYGWLADDDDAD